MSFHTWQMINTCLWVAVLVVQSLSRVWLFAIPWARACQVPLSSTISQNFSNSWPLSKWCYLNISSSAVQFFFCLQSFLASRYISVSQLFASGGQNIGASAWASVLPINIQGWFPLGLTGLISLQFPLNIRGGLILVPQGTLKSLLQHYSGRWSRTLTVVTPVWQKCYIFLPPQVPSLFLLTHTHTLTSFSLSSRVFPCWRCSMWEAG